MPARRRLALLLVALAATACEGESAAPSGAVLQGRYVLESVAGERLPAVLSRLGSVERVALADTLVFDADGSGEQVSVYRNRLSGGDGPVYRARSAFLHARAGQDVALSFPCPDPVLTGPVGCSAPPQMRGTLSGDRLTFTAAYAFRTPLRYRRR
jgi:hypothetical protein